MKKILGLLAIVVSVLIVFGTISKRAEANKAVFGTGSQDELENAKQISLGILRDQAAQRAIGTLLSIGRVGGELGDEHWQTRQPRFSSAEQTTAVRQ